MVVILLNNQFSYVSTSCYLQDVFCFHSTQQSPPMSDCWRQSGGHGRISRGSKSFHGRHAPTDQTQAPASPTPIKNDQPLTHEEAGRSVVRLIAPDVADFPVTIRPLVDGQLEIFLRIAEQKNVLFCRRRKQMPFTGVAAQLRQLSGRPSFNISGLIWCNTRNSLSSGSVNRRLIITLLIISVKHNC